MGKWKFYLETYGCRMNQSESEALREAWQRAGGEECPCAADADFILINSCAITARAERSARNAVFRLRQAAPGAKIILTGCAAQFYADFRPRKRANFALPDRIVPQARKAALASGPAGDGGGCAFLPIGAYDRARPVVRVQDGCSQNCAYCIVPQTRGRPRSRAPEEILAECRALAARGHGELVLSGVNLRQFAGGFWPLLRWLDAALAPQYEGKLRLRVSSIDPAMLNAEGLDALAACRLVCPHLHLSLQHGSAAVLERMGRGHYDLEKTRRALMALAQSWPLYGLGADFIAGFPGEREEDIASLLELIADWPLTYAHVFPYSRRQGTTAAAMPEQIERAKKEARASRLRAAVAVKRGAFARRMLDEAKMMVASEPPKNGQCRGVNEFFGVCAFAARPAGKGLIMARPRAILEGDVILVEEALAKGAFAG